ncbi:MAG: exodeoxyribonuclease VII large subunit [Lachnospiraceae bacterium]|nr:exodeoxyribonuclease VII large subunit [Lachnospiraceae bacterium]
MTNINKKVYTVSQVNSYIKRIFDTNTYLRYISIGGEVSNCRYSDAGHIYFTLKDKGGQLACAMFAGRRAGLSFILKDGMSVIVSGQIGVYERDGKYMMYADRIEQEGLGALYEEFEKLKAKLSAEGLFDPEKKKKIPEYPAKIGVITARTAAALQDIIRISRTRNPYVQLILSPATVQGVDAPESVCKALGRVLREKPDVVIIARGGGSYEDLFCFNDERIVRAVSDCPVPVISAIGHETDTTLIDLVADVRVPTPTAAAQLAVFDLKRFDDTVDTFRSRITRIMNDRIMLAKHKHEAFKAKIASKAPSRMIDNMHIRLDGIEAKIKQVFMNQRNAAYLRLEKDTGLLKANSPLSMLEKGFSYVTDENGRNLSKAEQFKKDQKISLRVSDGNVDAIVTECVKLPEE